MLRIVELLFAQLAKPLAFLGKISSLHPIHSLLITSLIASFAYLSIIQEYVSDGLSYEDAGSDLVHFYQSASGSSWTQVDDLSKLDNKAVSHYNVVPLEFSRGGDLSIPQVEGAVEVGSPELKFLIKDASVDLESEFESLNEIPAGTSAEGADQQFWKYRGFHGKLNKYSDLLLKYYNNLINLIKGAERFDIAIVTAAYTAMWYTFIVLFYDMKKSGSKFWLGFSALISSFFAFLFGLYTTTRFLNLDVPVLSLTEGIPFLVATVGFKSKSELAKQVLTQYSSKDYLSKGSSFVIYNSIKEQAVALLNDHLLVILAFTGCSVYAGDLEALRNFCILSSLILVFDTILTVTFFSSVLSLKLEMNVIHKTTILKQTLQEDGLTNDTVDKVLKDSSSDSNSSISYERNTLLSLIKISAISLFIGFHIYGFGSAWLYDLTFSSSSINKNLKIGEQIFNKLPSGSNGILITLYPSRVFLPQNVKIQIEDLILSIYHYISTGIRDKFISKSLLFAFTVSISINIYLLNIARFHTSKVSSDLKSSTSVKKSRTKSLSVPSSAGAPNSNSSTATPLKKSDSSDEITKSSEILSSDTEGEIHSPRSLETLVELMKDGKVKSLYDDEVVSLVTNSKLPLYALEKQLGDTTRAVCVRRKALAVLADAPVLNTMKLPYLHYDYDRVFGACCENVVGFMPLPVGIAGPLIIDNKPYHIPMATTEGCLVASAMRGCKAINLGGGVTTVLTKDGMTRGPCVEFPNLARAGACKIWLDSEEGQSEMKKAFNSTSRFARLQDIKTAIAGTLVYIRFRATTGDAMGMNMISKGVEFSLKQMVEEFGWDDMQIISVSGNYCIDKKPSAINWIEGRGKSVVAEAIIPKDAVSKVMKSNVKALVELNVSKNLVGSAMAGSIGGFNAHAANILTAVFLALGQDPAQNVESSQCITLMKENEDGDLQISVSMPCIEVGTIGGGTILDPQGSMLELLGVRGPADIPGENARQLAKIIASIVLAAELSLCSALAAGHLVQSHMTHNRAGAGAAKK